MSQSRRLPVLVAATLALSACLGDPSAPDDDAPPYEEGLAIPDIAPEDDGAGTHAPGPPPDEPDEPPPDEPPPDEPPPDEPPPDEPTDEETVPADCTQVRVVDTGGVVLNVRPAPNTDGDPVGTLSPGETVEVLDVVTDGEAVNGTSTWYEIADGALTGFISGAFTACIDPNAPPPAFDEDLFLLPLECGSHVRVTQGNNSDFSHNGGSRYAFDFGIPLNTPMLAMKAGTVVSVRIPTVPGDPCYDGGGSGCINEANSVTIDHGDGSNTLYAHINSAAVSQGDHVERGELVAYSGSTGYSTGPHAHVQRQDDCGSWWCQSIQMRFADFPEADGIPESSDWVDSQNGCE